MRFESLSDEPPDPLLQVIGAYRADHRPEKIDLGVGVYRDELGRTPVFRAVKRAEARLLDTQDSKSYVGPNGDLVFVEHLRKLILGDASEPRRTVGIQTTGGTAALRIGAEVLVRTGIVACHVGWPSWANHPPILKAAGLPMREHRHFDAFGQKVDFESVVLALSAASAGEAVLLQAGCHNPTGADFTPEQWRTVSDLIATRGILPLIDVAYPGLGAVLDQDLAGTRLLVSAAKEAVIAVSCSKTFGLYRERTGAVFATCQSAGAADAVMSNMLSVARAAYSMPPDHGAAVVRLILEDDILRSDWEAELAEMRERIAGLRGDLAELGWIGPLDLGGLARQNGMFSLLPLSPAQVRRLRDEFAVHMVDSGRINLAGLRRADVPRLTQALTAVV